MGAADIRDAARAPVPEPVLPDGEMILVEPTLVEPKRVEPTLVEPTLVEPNVVEPAAEIQGVQPAG